MQLSRVTVEDFLPFIKKCFDAVFSESAIEQLALSTPYALRHSKNHKQETDTGVGSSTGSVSVLHGSKPSVDLRMELNVESIAEVLRTVLVGTQDDDSNLGLASHSNLTLSGTEAAGSSEWRTDNSQDKFHRWTQVVDRDRKPELQSGLPLVAGTKTTPIRKSNSQHEVVDSSALEIKTKVTFPGRSSHVPDRENKDAHTSSSTGVASSSPETLRTMT